MPNKPLKLCSCMGCNELVIVGIRYCDKHRKDDRKKYDDRRLSFRQRGYTSDWDKVRLIKLGHNPLCEQCEKDGRLTPATLVHHIKSLRDNGSLLDMDNLMSLCIKCHDKVHVQQGDKW